MKIFVSLFTFLVFLGVALSFPVVPEENPAPANRTPASKPPSSPSSNASSDSKTSKVTEVQAALLCWDSSDCDYAQTDPRSYSFAVAKDIEEKLAQFLLEFQSDPTLSAEAELLAQDSMKILDGHVQSKAMEIFSQLPPSRKNLDSILSGLENSPNPLLIEQAMKEFERYLGSAEEQKIQEFLAEFIAHGAQFSSEKASEEIFRFLNQRSAPLFRETLTRMEPNSTPAQYLRSALLEFERTQSGG